MWNLSVFKKRKLYIYIKEVTIIILYFAEFLLFFQCLSQ